MKKFYPWLNYARGMGMLLVVLGHALADSFPSAGKEHPSQILFTLIYSFHMPLFFFLSGFLAYKLLYITDMKGKMQFVCQRFSRLMIPYFVVALIYVPLDWLFSRFATVQDQGNLLVNLLTGVNPAFQLWTLYALFICAVLECLCNPISQGVLLLLSVAVFLAGEIWTSPIQIVASVMKNACFFMAGIMFHEIYVKREKEMTALFKRTGVLLLSALVFFLVNALRIMVTLEMPIPDVARLLTSCSGICMILCIAVRLQESGENKFARANRLLWNTIGNYSMDIYIMSNLPQVLSRTVFVRLYPIPAILAAVISVALGVVLPIAASRLIIRKVRLLRRSILGMN